MFEVQGSFSEPFYSLSFCQLGRIRPVITFSSFESPLVISTC